MKIPTEDQEQEALVNITQERAKELLIYNADTGIFTRRHKVSGKRVHICSNKSALKCAEIREKYIIDNNLPHTRNFTNDKD